MADVYKRQEHNLLFPDNPTSNTVLPQRDVLLHYSYCLLYTSARKLYAVSEYRRTGSIERVKELLNHEDEAVTILYAMADQLERRRRKK